VKRLAGFFIVAMVLTLGTWLVWRANQPRENPQPVKVSQNTPTATGVTVTVTLSPVAIPSQTPLIGESILKGYADTNLPPENDLTLISHLMDNFTLIVKSAADRPLSANEDWAAALRGFNPAHERFLPDTHLALNADGKLVDRWGTPLFFHALGARRFELRSAGPDRKLWTADDLHRNADGSFRRGAALDAPSLLEAAARGTPPHSPVQEPNK
jgi:hypothetical protein